MKNAFFNWLTGKPSTKNSLMRTIFGKLLVGTMWIYIFYSFASGPGAVFASINPIGFTMVRSENNIIHYTNEFKSSIDYYSTAIAEARETVDAQWNRGEAARLDKQPVIHFYLTSAARDVAKLTMVNTPAVTLFGNKIVVSTDGIKEHGWDVAGVVKHEMSHVNCTARYGWIKGYFNFPIWLDEGIASNFSEFPQHAEKYFNELLVNNAGLNSLTKLNNIFAWQSELFRDHDTFIKQYGYARWFTGDLITRYGMDKLKQYFSGNVKFSALSGQTLDSYERRWIEGNKLKQLIPSDVTIVYPGISWKVMVLWGVQSAAVIAFAAFLLLWMVRQGFKLGRLMSFVPVKANA